MNVIIEGPEATGKTTFGQKLIERFNMKYLHLTSETANDFCYHNQLLDNNNTVYDRFLFGEYVYPKIYNRDPKMSMLEMHKLFRKIMQNGDVFIILYASNIETLKERLIERGEYEFLDQILKQNELFLEIGNIFKLYDYDNFHIVDISDERNYDLLDQIVEKSKKTINYEYKKICQDLLKHGHQVGNTTEINNYTFTIDDLDNNVVSLKTRDISLSYLIAEMIWYWTGRNDVDFIGKFASLWKRISDDGITNNSAYGYLLKEGYGFNQVETMIDLFESDINTRRAVININVPNSNVKTTKDEPCTIALNFYVRDNKLYCTGIMRSNDVYFGLTYDIIFFTELQKYIAKRLNLEVGSYTHFATSMHFYERDQEKIELIANGNYEIIDDQIEMHKLLYTQKLKELEKYIDQGFTTKDEFVTEAKSKEIIRIRDK